MRQAAEGIRLLGEAGLGGGDSPQPLILTQINSSTAVPRKAATWSSWTLGNPHRREKVEGALSTRPAVSLSRAILAESRARTIRASPGQRVS